MDKKPEKKQNKDKDKEQVKVWDIKTGTGTLMPARELAQGMIQVRLRADDGTEETVWTDGHELQGIDYGRFDTSSRLARRCRVSSFASA